MFFFFSISAFLNSNNLHSGNSFYHLQMNLVVKISQLKTIFITLPGENFEPNLTKVNTPCTKSLIERRFMKKYHLLFAAETKTNYKHIQLFFFFYDI